MASILGGLSPAAFLEGYWQKRPLLVRQAFPRFRGIVDRDALLALAERRDVTSRLVIEHPRARSRWERHDGPFGGIDAGMLPASHWTLLVHGVESLVPGGWELLRAFSFIPAARIDDLMVSYAANGGSVGAHEDRYDVFLLQGPGRRRWQVSTRGDRALDPGMAIQVLRSFVPEQEWVLEPGDMLYLPPGVAHLGVAVGECFTYSIGFLAPRHDELIQGFFGHLAGELGTEGIYEDPDLAPARDRLELPDAMIERVEQVVGALRWDRADVEEFLGRWLTRPRPHVRFEPPRRPLASEDFARRLRGRGRLSLALPSRGLVRRGRLFLNGRSHAASRATLGHFEALVNERALQLPRSLDARTLSLFHTWHLAGFVTLDRGHP